jgi:thiol-disulfide isomerase/thioredoxin
VGSTHTQGYQWNGCVIGDHLFVAELHIASAPNSRNGISVFDLKDPSHLTERAFVATATPFHLLPVGADRLLALASDSAQLFRIAAGKLTPLGKPIVASGRSGAVLAVDGREYLITSNGVLRIEDGELVPIGRYAGCHTIDGFPYPAAVQGQYAVIPGDDGAVFFRPESRSAARLEAAAAPVAAVERGSKVKAGQELDLAGPTVDGGTFDLKKLRGKVVLVDFWATWCGPCVAEMPNVKRVYERHHKDGFEVVGVSLDQSREALLRFIKAKEMPWPQLFFDNKDAQGWNNPLARKYDINAIPMTILIDRAGKVVEIGLRGEALEPAVARLLGDQTRAASPKR